jgi:hypothetical protein
MLTQKQTKSELEGRETTGERYLVLPSPPPGSGSGGAHTGPHGVPLETIWPGKFRNSFTGRVVRVLLLNWTFLQAVTSELSYSNEA